MMRLILACVVPLLAAPALAQTGGVDRLYVMDCGDARAPDQARWSPGVNVGKPLDIVDNCYLIHDAKGYLLWDTGIPDSVAAAPGSMPGLVPWHRSKTLVAQLAGVGVKPEDIRYVAVSHTHGDHVGNVDLFPAATVLIQRPEYEWAFADGKKPFSPDHPVQKLGGDQDVFGDGAAMIVSTPGHTPGHQSLLVHLPKTGWLLLSGDAAHFRDNFVNRRVPSMNTDAGDTVVSMQRLADLQAKYDAQLWINHDAPQSAQTRHAPEFYE